MTQVQERIQQEFEEYCRRAYEGGDRPAGRDASGWVGRKAADFFAGRLDMSDAQNVTMIGILRQVAEWDTGENAPRITVTRVEVPGPGSGETQPPSASEQLDPWADAGGAPVGGESGVEQVVDEEIPEDLR